MANIRSILLLLSWLSINDIISLEWHYTYRVIISAKTAMVFYIQYQIDCLKSTGFLNMNLKNFCRKKPNFKKLSNNHSTICLKMVSKTYCLYIKKNSIRHFVIVHLVYCEWVQIFFCRTDFLADSAFDF